ncbi:hypothetical protein EWH21_13215 [Pseudomonas sp. REST10]|uniref:nSTAND1 domain-containing NTPase n=1 Tax=Pseudomonas sp. REST10 TaxID=2512235 RepID=UPI00240D5B0E|nr:AAA family ATPase [Pseudomonas sp. REST10]WFC62636.1 hypothetical protein EWH21_13215 [Pseudomonas sp. REST10]
MLTVTQVENAFLPAKEIVDAERFSGREGEITDAFYALVTEGSNIAIVGNRGIGKTSLARQVLSLGQGDNSILEKTGLAGAETLDFATFYYACGRQVENTEQLLDRLLTSNNCLSEWIYEIPSASRIMAAYSPKFGVNLLGVSAELGGEKETETTSEKALQSHSVDAVFTNVVDAIVKAGISKNGLLIVIDEFDQIANPAGFASYIKALATNCPGVKFCLVGVAKDIQGLMKEHESTDRLFSGSIVALEPMTGDELRGIIDNAERVINKAIAFEEDARQSMVDLAQGHPYMIHLIGKFCLRSAFREGRDKINAEDVRRTLSDIAERRSDPVLEGKYRKAVASSPQREIVLKAMARSKDEQGEIWTTNAYKAALDGGVDNASQYVGQLVTDEYGAEVEKLRERYYRFKDSLFHAYVCARPDMYKK